MSEKRFKQKKLVTRDIHRSVTVLWDDQIYLAKKEARETNKSRDYVIRKALDHYFKIQLNEYGELVKRPSND
jgi:predicted transcriptional regulator